MLIGFALLAVAWTWPLARHLHDALPGDPGDNYSFVWNLWWMRHVLATPALPYFHTTYLFYPFGTTIADHPHTALPALVAATLLRPATVVTAQNLLLLGYVALNLATMYALAWSITRHLRASIVAAAVFGLSPYLAVHMLGHFDLVAAFTIPLYALALRRRAGIAAGLALAATAYIAYYYVVYLLFFTAAYLIAWTRPLVVTRAPHAPATAARIVRAIAWAGAVACFALAIAIVVSGGWSFRLLGADVPAHRPQNALSGAWILAVVALLVTWRPSVRVNRAAIPGCRAAAVLCVWIALIFAVGTAPLEWQAARLVASGEYVTPEYGWRSIPHGVDLLAPFAGHPLHPVSGALSRRGYAVFGENFIETVGWFGIVPLALLLAGLSAPRRGEDAPAAAPLDDLERERGAWRAVALVFVVWALGPFLVVGGFDTGLKLPAILLRYVPFVANARMPGRAIVVVFMAVAVLLAIAVRGARGRLASPALQWLAIAAIVAEYWAGPLRLTPVDRPGVYDALAAAPQGAVCEVPLGIGDGLSGGVGSQERRVLLYATEHEHPLVGGYIGRMPHDAADRIRTLPIAGTLLALSDGGALPAAPDLDAADSPCRYLVVDRRAISPAVSAYLRLLAPTPLASDERRDLLRLR